MPSRNLAMESGIEAVSMDEHIDYMAKVELARGMLPCDKMMLGIEMFEAACADIRTRILATLPNASAEAVEQILRILVERADRF